VDVANEFQQVGFLLYEDRLEASLKQMAMSTVSSVEGASIAAQESVEEAGDAEGAPRPEQEVHMLWGAVGYVQWVA
jgi:hypothetical protein